MYTQHYIDAISIFAVDTMPLGTFFSRTTVSLSSEYNVYMNS